MAQPFQARVLGGRVRVLAQHPQHGHQLPHPSEVVLWLRGEGRGTTGGGAHPRGPHPATRPRASGWVPSECAGGLGPGFGQNLRGGRKNSEIKRNNTFM